MATTARSDWMGTLQSHVNADLPEVDLDQMRPGDWLWVVTGNTNYVLVFGQGREAQLRTNRADRPSGQVWVQGCTFGMSSTIKPGSLFCGGNLEFLFADRKMVHRTSAITRLLLQRRG